MGVILFLELTARAYLFAGIPADYQPVSVFDKISLFFSGGSYVCEFRGQRYPFKKPKNVFRVAAVGGSATAGVAGDRETWTFKLAARLNASAPPGLRYEVINLGQCGANSSQEYFYLVTHGYLDPEDRKSVV